MSTNGQNSTRRRDYQWPRGWRATVDLSVLDDDTLDAKVRAHAALDMLLLHQHVFSYRGMPNLIQRLAAAVRRQDWNGFDVELDTLYSIADHERVWLG
jgi:hypothetical protein